jgi:hypothetical protein
MTLQAHAPPRTCAPPGATVTLSGTAASIPAARQFINRAAANGGVPHSAVVSVARAMRRLEAEGLMIICVPGCRRQGAQTFDRLSRALRNRPAA